MYHFNRENSPDMVKTLLDFAMESLYYFRPKTYSNRWSCDKQLGNIACEVGDRSNVPRLSTNQNPAFSLEVRYSEMIVICGLKTDALTPTSMSFEDLNYSPSTQMHLLIGFIKEDFNISSSSSSSSYSTLSHKEAVLGVVVCGPSVAPLLCSWNPYQSTTSSNLVWTSYHLVLEGCIFLLSMSNHEVLLTWKVPVNINSCIEMSRTWNGIYTPGLVLFSWNATQNLQPTFQGIRTIHTTLFLVTCTCDRFFRVTGDGSPNTHTLHPLMSTT